MPQRRVSFGSACLVKCNTRSNTKNWRTHIMNDNFSRHAKNTPRARGLYVAALMLVCAFGTVTSAAGQKITSPATPALITPPAGNSAFLLGHAVGTQGYVCLPKGSGASWTVNNARPEA